MNYHLIAALDGSKIVQMINDRSQKEVLISAAGIFSIVTDLVRAEILIIKDFISKMPSIIERAQETIRHQLFRGTFSQSVLLARRNMGDQICIVDNSPVFRNCFHNSIGKVSPFLLKNTSFMVIRE